MLRSIENEASDRVAVLHENEPDHGRQAAPVFSEIFVLIRGSASHASELLDCSLGLFAPLGRRLFIPPQLARLELCPRVTEHRQESVIGIGETPTDVAQDDPDNVRVDEPLKPRLGLSPNELLSNTAVLVLEMFTAELSAQTGLEDVEVGGLGYVVVRAGVNPFNHRIPIVARREHDDGDVAPFDPLLDAPARLLAGQSRHDEIE